MKEFNRKEKQDEVYRNFQTIRLDEEEKNDVLDKLLTSMKRKKSVSRVSFRILPIYTAFMIVFLLFASGVFLGKSDFFHNTFSQGGVYTPQIPILKEYNMELIDDTGGKWLIQSDSGKTVGRIYYSEQDFADEMKIAGMMEHRTIDDYNYPAIFIREHVKTMEVFQTHHYFIDRSEADFAEPYVYIQIYVPYHGHELEDQAAMIMESFQENN
jgi:hypothetical protein